MAEASDPEAISRRKSGIGRVLKRLVFDQAVPMARTIVSAKDEESRLQLSALIALGIRGAGAGAAYLLQVLLAQALGAYEYGLFAYAWIWILIGGRSGSLGFAQASIRFIAAYRDADDPAHARGFIAASQAATLFGGLLVAGIGLAGLALFPQIVANPYLAPLYLALICIPIVAYQDLLEGQALAWSWTGLALAPTFLIRQVLILATVAIAITAGWPATAATAMSAVIVAVTVSMVGQYAVLRWRIRRAIPPGEKRFRIVYWIKTAIPLFMMGSLQMVLAFSDILILGFFVEPALVALYFAATRINTLIALVQYAVGAACGQRFAGLAVSGDREALRAFIRKTVQWMFYPSIAVGLIIIAAGWPLLRMFGPQFVDAYPILPILVSGMIIRASVGGAEELLIMLGHERTAFAAQLFCTITNVALNLALIPAFGIYGAAIGTTLALALYAAALEFGVRRGAGLTSWIATLPPPAPVDAR